MPTAFISYRRDDSKSFVARLRTTLDGAFDDLEVFVDTGGIEAGEDYLKVLQSHVEQDLVFLAVIGPHWAGGQGRQSRIHDPDDMVRREIEWRLKNWRSDIIPILIDGASMPEARDLPEGMRGLVRLNALEISESDFATGIAALARRLDRILAKDAEDGAELDALEAQAREEAEANPIPVEPAGLRVPVFILTGKWNCDVQGPANDPLTGPNRHLVIEFEVAADGTMTGSLFWPGRREKGRKVGSEQIEGEAMLFKERHATLYGGDHVDRVCLQGVVGSAQSFKIEIPVHMKLGKIYHGSDAQGRQYALRLLKASKGRFGF